MSSAPRIYCKSCGNCAPVHSLTCPERKPVKRMTEEREDLAEEETTPDEVREAVEMAWTDATHLPPSREQGELCSHLRQATEILDGILESQKKSPEQRLLDRITKDFGIEGDEDAYETVKRLEAAATRLAEENRNLRAANEEFRRVAKEAKDTAEVGNILILTAWKALGGLSKWPPGTSLAEAIEDLKRRVEREPAVMVIIDERDKLLKAVENILLVRSDNLGQLSKKINEAADLLSSLTKT